MTQLTARFGPWHAEWHGGEYAEVFHDSKLYSLDVINMWDYDTDSARVPFEPASLKHELAEWVESVGDDYARELPYL